MIDDGDRKLIAQANRNGFFYVLDRTNGKLISATSYAKVTWSTSKDATGRPVPDKNAVPTPEGNRVCPGAAGSTNWMSPTYDPQTKLFYVTAREQCDIFATAPQPYEAGHAYYGSAYFPTMKRNRLGRAARARSRDGKVKWEWKHTSPTWAGVLSTAGGLVFTGMRKETLSRLTPLLVRRFGTSSAGRRCIRRRCRLRWTGSNTWRWLQGQRFLPLACPNRSAPGAIETKISPKVLIGIYFSELDGNILSQG